MVSPEDRIISFDKIVSSKIQIVAVNQISRYRHGEKITPAFFLLLHGGYWAFDPEIDTTNWFEPVDQRSVLDNCSGVNEDGTVAIPLGKAGSD